ncbi:hypothetical protein BACUNI_00033 [Bacteroides uniformis ATCC 8492]|uniref:Uncharacterized protein n=1 Tax=Bacteroides uniformis (strain ATCC 8492 / DSM 6597 / CCUG 4942 / CIP 103695 / JCM 5828 / KCTC 5204 / NCTC 13054 / VPI 0061) TaxID=411479 RepID=A0ABC9NI75_BACUC|nr:hypothetical protein BACUNI_00033 [Bacteroides uniformis ATCC 8492]
MATTLQRCDITAFTVNDFQFVTGEVDIHLVSGIMLDMAYDMCHHTVTHEIVAETGMSVSVRDGSRGTLRTGVFTVTPRAAKPGQHTQERSASKLKAGRCDGSLLRPNPFREPFPGCEAERQGGPTPLSVYHTLETAHISAHRVAKKLKLLLICFILSPMRTLEDVCYLCCRSRK